MNVSTNKLCNIAESTEISVGDVVSMFRRGEDPNQAIPFMRMNRISRRRIMKDAKRLAKKEKL